jgi:NADH-quinone oxidoreductase subunit N
LSAYVLASFMRRDARSAEAGLKYFVLGALASGILLYGISLLYGFTGTTLFAGIADSLGRAASTGGISTGQMFGIVFILAGLAFKISAVPFHMWTPDVYEGAPTPVTAFFASAPKVAGMALLMRVSVEAMGAGTDAWRQIVDLLGARLDDPRRRGGDRAEQHQAAAGLFVDQQCRLRAVRPRRRHRRRRRGRADDLYGGLCRDDARQLPVRAADARPPKASRSKRSPACRACRAARPALAAALAMFMFSLAGIPPLFGFWPKFLVFDALVRSRLLAVGDGRYRNLGDRRLLLSEDRQDDVLRRTGAANSRRRTARLEGGLIALSALFVSPLGYLAIPFLGLASMTAARSLF